MSYLFNRDNRFTLALPDSWTCLDDDDSLYSFSAKENGYGALQISFGKKDKIADTTELESVSILKNFLDNIGSEPGITTDKITNGYMSSSEFTKENRFSRVWLISNNERFAFITYNSSLEDKNKEKEIVDEIINSFYLVN